MTAENCSENANRRRKTMPKKPTNTLTWKKDDKYATIEKFLYEKIYIDKDTGKEVSSIKQVSEIPPITRKRKPKRKSKRK